ncbi:hypothetical protein LOTGIDRAFT_153678 [Lottia gigantea]|uniref:Bile salt export pump n=1 Tax=Lottia gigantea TaxID=225164 RepID=V4AD38_LOTGI|nr:hypothetical protein LOTGIDRAFT_153678 [Lottia gigantea]ESO91246.1 hypothetical protein LOTGIDRAFT_153678 [Lottia gigantea]
MTTYAIYYCIIGASMFVLSTIQVAFWTMACERQTNKIRKAFFQSILRQDQGWFDQHQSGELTTRLSDDLERIREGIGDKFSLCIQFVAQFISGFAIGFTKSWKLTLVMMSLTPLLAVCAAFVGKLVASYSKKEQTSYAQAGSVAEEVLSCIRTVTSFNGQKKEINRYATSLEESKRLGIKKSVVVGLGVGLTFVATFGAYALAFWYGSTLVNDFQISNGEDGIDPGTVMTVFFCVMVASMALGSASPHASAVATAKGAAAVVLDVINRVPPIDSTSELGTKPDRVNGKIDFVGVDFSYPTRSNVKVLKNFNISIEPGQTVALVGASGCGKSTTVNMIQRFYDPTVGSVYLDGHNLKDINIKWLRQNIGVVSQEPILFGRSIAENIQLGEMSVTYNQIVQAAKDANVHDFINGLPQGYETLVGERGAQLSGGQKQRVAIARALVRNPRILLLDEATSALDSTSEKVVQDALEKARKGRTTVVVAHRLSTIQNADLIYVLENGILVEQGRHEELMARQGVYHQLVTLQTIGDMKDNEDDDEEPTLKPSFSKILKSNAPEWPFIVMGCIVSSLNGALMPLFAFFLSEIIKTFGYTGQKLLDEGIFWSLMFLGLGVCSFMFNLIQNVSFGSSGEKLTARLRLQCFRSLVRQEISYFDDPKHSTGALTTRLATDASMVKNATGIRIGIMLQSAVSLIAGITIGFVYGWKLALVICAAVPIMALAGALHMKTLSGGQKKDAELLEEAGKTSSEAVENARTVQSLTREKHFYDRYAQMLLKPFQANMKHAVVYAIAYGFSQGVIFLLYAGAFRFGAYLVAINDMEPDKVFRVFFAIAFTGLAVGQATSFLPDYSKAKLSSAYIFRILATFPGIDIFSARGQRPVSLKGEIELRNVEFTYPLRPDVKVLQGLSLKVEAGQTAALVGVSGCGKSTVISLIQRYYDPLHGEITIDGIPVNTMHLLTLRSFISVVSQEPILFDCSIKDNICYGLEEDIPMDRVIQASRTANAHDFINSLPLGYDTMVGEKGAQLSGGQKQRVAIARALVRNPRILLLDEATSALDTESEKVVQTALDNAQEGRTCIVIAHRLSTIQNADIIYVIDNGIVSEQGTHQQLLENNGAYAKLVRGQKFK